MSSIGDETEELRKTLYVLVESVCGLLQEKIDSGIKPPQEEVRTVSRKPDSSGFELEISTRIDFNHLLEIYSTEINELEAANHSIKQIESNSIMELYIGSRVFSSLGFSFYVDVKLILSTFLQHQFTMQSDIRINGAIFEQNFTAMMESFSSDTVKIETWIPIEHFTSDCDALELIDGWRIQRISNDRLSDLIPKYYELGIVGMQQSKINTHYALIKIVEAKKHVYKEEDKPDTEFELIKHIPISLGLRLLKKGFFCFGATRRKYLDWLFGIDAFYSNITKSDISGQRLGSKYHLNQTDIEELRNIISLSKKIDRNSMLEVPLRRFNFGIGRIDYEDRLIDYMIAFESLFLRLDSELSFRLSLRVAKFLCIDDANHGELFNIMKVAYTTRSKIVHGAKREKISEYVQKNGFTLRTLTEQIEDILRQSLKKLIELEFQGINLPEICNRIDLDITRGTSFSQ